MTDERKKEISLRIKEITHELMSYAKEFGETERTTIDIMACHSSIDDHEHYSVWLHDGDRMVSIRSEEELENILLIERDDTVKHDEKGEDEHGEAV